MIAIMFSLKTRMHSSRMRTARSSSRRGGVSTRHPPWDHAPPGPCTPPEQAPREQTSPSCGQTHACKHITLPQTSFAGGNNWLQPHSGVTPLFSLRTVSIASSQSCWSVDTDAWYKWGLELREGDIFTGACHSAQEVGVPM